MSWASNERGYVQVHRDIDMAVSNVWQAGEAAPAPAALPDYADILDLLGVSAPKVCSSTLLLASNHNQP